MRRTIETPGGPLSYELTRKAVKNLNFRLLPGGELKETFSSRLRPEDSEPEMTQGKDATDRLLARKKPERRRKKSGTPAGSRQRSPARQLR